ncbi:hypothetical protein EC912_102286 [Luteibacter rhizovicinus]|uniref:Uncharacterized protein n=1 Tax=Luteibacter rhizovicinus TaxID=242606 RepID=A0A4R3YTS3_9GAMM|nr:hypothetical protein [Luteibacter rhizovicinus]TCV95941.1 hypothetical protein EC912_102286 [Luteibacter rhizovicinus]
MRVQLQGHTVRLRIDEDELSELLGGVSIIGTTAFGSLFLMRYAVSLHEGRTCRLDGQAADWRIDLPDAEVRELASRLPSKEGLIFDVPTGGIDAMRILFDVDVKDSARRRRNV